MEKLESRKFKSSILQAWQVMEFNGLISRGLVIHKQEKINAKNQRRYVVVMSPLSGNLRTTTKFTTTTSVDWEKTGTRTSVSARKRKVKMQSVGSRRRRH